MPCDSSPSPREIELSRKAVEAQRKLDYERKKQCDKVTRMLCEICGKMEKKYPAAFMNVSSSKLRIWWEDHQKQDLSKDS